MSKFPWLLLAGLVVFASFAFAALHYSNELWQQITFTSVFVVLVASILISFAATRPMRWFWVGFAVVGWLYFGIIYFDGSFVWSSSDLLTQKALELLQERAQLGIPRETPNHELVVADDVDVQIYSSQNASTSSGGGLSPARPITISLETAARRGYLQYAYSPIGSPRPKVSTRLGTCCGLSCLVLWEVVLVFGFVSDCLS